MNPNKRNFTSYLPLFLLKTRKYRSVLRADKMDEFRKIFQTMILGEQRMNVQPLGIDQWINESRKIEYNHEFKGKDVASYL